MKKTYLPIAFILFVVMFAFVSGGGFSANLLSDPFAPEGSVSEKVNIRLANGVQMNLSKDIDALLAGKQISAGKYKIAAKIMVTDPYTGSSQFIDFPYVERMSEGNDIFRLPVIRTYEDIKSGLVWEVDATQSGLKTYTEAQQYCSDFGQSVEGDSFRVPSAKDFLSILKRGGAGIDTDIFDNLNDNYWTTSEYAYSFYDRSGIRVDKRLGLAYVRCVGTISE